MSGQRRPLIVLAAGGTGGHVFPAQALAEEMLSRKWRVKFWTDARGLRFVSEFPDEVKIETVPSATIAGGGTLTKALSVARIGMGITSALFRIAMERPSVVAGFGGYAAFPPVFAAIVLRTPSLIHEQNGVLGRANRVLANRVAVVACAAGDTEVPPGSRLKVTGNPVRANVVANSGVPYTPPNGIINLVVTGGSQAARLFDDIVPRAVAALPGDVRGRLRILHQVRSGGEDVMDRYSRMGVDAETKVFIPNLPERIAHAQLVISRSGASSISELCAIGRPSILVPYAAAANDEQTANANVLVREMAAISISEAELNPEQLANEMMNIISCPGRARAMAEAAKSLAKLDAKVRLGNAVEEIARIAA